MMGLIDLMLHPSTVSFTLGMMAGSYLTITYMFRRKARSMRAGR